MEAKIQKILNSKEPEKCPAMFSLPPIKPELSQLSNLLEDYSKFDIYHIVDSFVKLRRLGYNPLEFEHVLHLHPQVLIQWISSNPHVIPESPNRMDPTVNSKPNIHSVHTMHSNTSTNSISSAESLENSKVIKSESQVKSWILDNYNVKFLTQSISDSETSLNEIDPDYIFKQKNDLLQDLFLKIKTATEKSERELLGAKIQLLKKKLNDPLYTINDFHSDAEIEQTPRIQSSISDDNSPESDSSQSDICGMFDQLETESPAAPKTYITHNFSTSTWVGATPREILSSWVKTKKGLKFKITHPQSPASGFKAMVVLFGVQMPKTSFEMSENELCASKNDSQEYICLKTLYELDQKSDAYKRLAPVFRDLWKKWSDSDNQFSMHSKETEVEKLMQVFRRIQEKIAIAEPIGSIVTPKIAPLKSYRNGTSPAKLKSQLKSRMDSSKYQKLFLQRQELPISKMAQDIMREVNLNRVVIISGETGSGKSTQVPQYILESLIESEQYVNIVCTQPRRISATSIAQRVSEELGDKDIGKNGSLVGYQVRLENATSCTTKLVFCTTGILLKKLESDKQLSAVTHVIIDEVHEQTLESDFLLYLCRKLLYSRADFKLILMSATANAVKFAQYFDQLTCAIISVPGKTFPVQTWFLEDIVEQTGFEIEQDDYIHGENEETAQVKYSVAGGKKKNVTIRWEQINHASSHSTTEYSAETLDTVARIRPLSINYSLILHLIHFIQSNFKDINGAVLVFLPGIAEISRMAQHLETEIHIHRGELNWKVFKLHSSTSKTEQSKIFQSTSGRKIVLSTNVAETGITIPDVVFVIDSMMAREVSHDQKRGMKRLVDITISKSNASQRRGRAGRTQAGFAFHLISTPDYQKLPQRRPPESLRLPLEEISLYAKKIEQEISLEVILGRIPEPPPATSVKKALELLLQVGALDENENITPIGDFLLNLPIDVRLGKTILFAIILKCFDTILIVCSFLTLGKSPILETKRIPTEHVHSNAYAGYEKACDTHAGQFAKIKSFCDVNGLSLENCILISDTKKQLLKTIQETGILNQFATSSKNPQLLPELNIFSNSYNMISSAFGAGFSPNLLVYDCGDKTSHRMLHLLNSKEPIKVQKSSVCKLPAQTSFFTYYDIQVSKKQQAQFTTVRDLNRISTLAMVILSSSTPWVDISNCYVLLKHIPITFGCTLQEGGSLLILHHSINQILRLVVRCQYQNDMGHIVEQFNLLTRSEMQKW